MALFLCFKVWLQSHRSIKIHPLGSVGLITYARTWQKQSLRLPNFDAFYNQIQSQIFDNGICCLNYDIYLFGGYNVVYNNLQENDYKQKVKFIALGSGNHDLLLFRLR